MLEQYLLALTITFGLLGLAGYLAQRYGQKLQQRSRTFTAQPANMHILESLQLSPTHQLHRVQAGPQVLTLLTHPQGAQVVSTHSTPPNTETTITGTRRTK